MKIMITSYFKMLKMFFLLLRLTFYPVSDYCNFRGLPPSIDTFFKEKKRSELEVAPINMSPEVAPDNAARAEPRWRCNRYDAEGDAADSIGRGAGYE